MFGKVLEVPQKETTPFYPRSPYGVSKAAAYYMARVYRESYGMKIYCGFLFNHESERRGEEFLSRKVCKAVAEIVNGKRDKLVLGNLDAKRDFGYAKEYVEWIWNIMQYHTPDDFVIATGETHSVREWVETAFKHAGINNWEDYVEYDKSLTRPAEVDLLIGDASKSKTVLGFEPKVKFEELVKIMTDAELNLFK
jgi:GDPmannose 4,6-dehydratase